MNTSRRSSVGRAPSNYGMEVGGSSPYRRDQPFRQFEFRWGEHIGLSECPYLIRYTLTMFGMSLRIHHWLASDDQRYLHDHPWDYLTLIVCGGYTDISPETSDRLSFGSFRYRKAEHRHTVRVDTGGCWSLLLTWPKRRNWGFWIPGRDKILRPLRYFSRFGHHPCE